MARIAGAGVIGMAAGFDGAQFLLAAVLVVMMIVNTRACRTFAQ